MTETKLHTPSSGGIVFKDGKVLIIHSPSRNTYSFPKGTIDEGETNEQTALREVKEETGYNVRILRPLDDSTFEFDSGKGFIYRKTVSYFVMELADDKDPVPNLQHGEDFTSLWVPIKDAYSVLTFDDARELLKQAEQA